MSYRHASQSFGREGHPCKYPWPDDCYVQCGGNGIVLVDANITDVFANPDAAEDIVLGMIAETPIKQQHYRTAFFEAFPRDPDTFLRGEGAKIQEAEDAAWQKYQKINQCTGHEFERRGYKNGAGFCKHCNMFKSKVFEPDESCIICNAKTYYGQTKNHQWYCEECKDKIPRADLPDWKLELESIDESDSVSDD